MNIEISKEALILHLTNNLVNARAEDLRIAKRHQIEENNALMQFRKDLREALKWTYKQAKASRYRELTIKSPGCPTSQAEPIARELRGVMLDTRKSLTIKPDSDLGKAVNWVPASMREKKSLCD